MIVRESPKSKVKTNQPNWPPQSPIEALLSSPSGRRKYESQRERNSVSPSPTKRRPMSRGIMPDDEEEDDEETLQLKLQAIEAKLRLKALQRKNGGGLGDFDRNGASSRASTAMGMRRVALPRPEADVQVPHSPVRIRRAPEEQRSPARVILGIDKGLTARDVSLKRPGSGMNGGLLRSSSTRGGEPPKIKSFSERIAESRGKEKDRGEKETKAEERRNRGFGLHNIEELKDRPSLSRTSSSQSSETTRSREMPPPAARHHSRAQSIPTSILSNPPTPRLGSTLSFRSGDSRPTSSASRPASSFGTTPTASKYAEISNRDDSTDAPSFEPFSGLHLKSREMQHNLVTRTLEGKTVLTLPQLLKTVKAPEYDPPEWENDYVVLGVICSKSVPHTSKNAAKDQTKGNQEKGLDQNGKFMVLRLTDLKWELDLFLFDTGFSQFWKLPVGTLVAILNPDIMPPRNRDTGKFSLKLSSSDDTILELGTARDLDFCHAQKKDGKDCGQWIDSRKTEFCEFHIQLQVEKAKKGRMQVNTMTGFGGGPGSGKLGMFSGRGGGPKGDELKREGKYHDRELHETVYIAPRPGGAARLIDRDRQNWEGGSNREDRFRKQLAEKERERELAKKLGTMGNGSTGGDYMKLKGAGTQNLPARGYTSSQGSTGAKPDKPAGTDFKSLLNRTSADVSLAPVKRKRTASTKSIASTDPVGWGFKYGRIPSPKKDVPSAFRGTREISPAKKKARLFLPEKGIREPGRESLGGMDVGLIAAMDDEDDDLEVV
ncbi:hypothetical protein EJ02DRAFT_375174 [Clathrospora elynae]|uniref:Uncharacterized protein n=1 Tax=Clathrospora elynae TaxID=706981 RepID=A0A6A5SQ83_9PLEO|nr:hypothetical protein EJ02DRAFT_375174 [Clathrospora elynae]